MLNQETSKRTTGREFGGETFKLHTEIKCSYIRNGYDRSRAQKIRDELKAEGYKVRVVSDQYENWLVYYRPTDKMAPACPKCGEKMMVYAHSPNGSIWRGHYGYNCKPCQHSQDW